MQKLLLVVLVSAGVLIGACVMKAPQDVSQAASAAAVVPKGVLVANSVTTPAPGASARKAVAMQAPAKPSRADAETAPQAATKPAAIVGKDVAVRKEIKAENDVKSEIKPSKFATLASVAGSLPLISMLRGEDGRISPINMMMKIRSMMPMCAGNANCVTTSTGFQRVSVKTAEVAPLTVAKVN